MRRLVKCPYCASPLELVFSSMTEDRYRCSVCGKQTTVLIERAVVAGEELEGGESAA